MVEGKDDVFDFPCTFPIKVMGFSGKNLETLVVDVLRKHVGTIDLGSIRARESGNNKYVSITVSIEARSREQLDAIYKELAAHEDVLMAL